MSVTRRHWLASATMVMLFGTFGLQPAMADLTSGRPFEGQKVNVLAVQSTQFAAQEKRKAEFEEATGIKVNFIYVPFVALRERLTAEMVGQSDDFDIVTVMDVWIPSMVGNYRAPLDDFIAERGIDMARYPGSDSHFVQAVDHAAAMRRALRRSRSARPYICRLMSLRRFTFPST